VRAAGREAEVVERAARLRRRQPVQAGGLDAEKADRRDELEHLGKALRQPAQGVQLQCDRARQRIGAQPDDLLLARQRGGETATGTLAMSPYGSGAASPASTPPAPGELPGELPAGS
jgi:hypothetical protein